MWVFKASATEEYEGSLAFSVAFQRAEGDGGPFLSLVAGSGVGFVGSSGERVL